MWCTVMDGKAAIKHGKKYRTARHKHVLVSSDNITIQSDSKLDVTGQFMMKHKPEYNMTSLSNNKTIFTSVI